MRSDYLAYMLRLWQVEEGGQLTWRGSLEEPGKEARYNFASVYDLVAFLEEQTNQTGSVTFQHYIVEKNEHEETSIEIKVTLKSPKNVRNQEK